MPALQLAFACVKIWNPRSHVCSDVRSTVAAATAAAPGLVFNRDTNLIAVFASSNKTDFAGTDHEANRLVFMTILLVKLQKILIPDPYPPPM